VSLLLFHFFGISFWHVSVGSLPTFFLLVEKKATGIKNVFLVAAALGINNCSNKQRLWHALQSGRLHETTRHPCHE